MKWVVGRGSAAEVGRWSWLGRGRGWVVAEVASVMIFFEWVCSGGFQIGWISNRGWVVVVVRFQIGSSDDFFLLAWVCVCLCLCLCLCLRESEKKKKRLESPGKWNHA